MNTIVRAALAICGLAMMPAALSAHEGHGWLAGAAQPLIGLDHFLAGLFVAVAVGVGVGVAARRSGRSVSGAD
jgi:hydrogenase/urease accessory protein HupE